LFCRSNSEQRSGDDGLVVAPVNPPLLYGTMYVFVPPPPLFPVEPMQSPGEPLGRVPAPLIAGGHTECSRSLTVEFPET
jgi:hypothetical protein